MGFLDLFKKSPPAAPPRNNQRAMQAGMRKQMRLQGFAGGVVDRLTASLQQWSGAVNADLDGQLVILRARARALAANNEAGRRFLNLLAANVIGPSGPRLQVRARQTDGVTLDKIANDTIEIAWDKWCAQADVSGRMDFKHLLRVVIKAVARDGEALVRIVRDRSLPNGMQLQLIEIDRLDEAMNATLSNGNIIRQGVELTSYLKPVAYWIKTSHPGENYQQRPAKAERLDAKFVFHVYMPERAEQVRGYTWFHAVIRRMSMLGDFEEAAVVAAQVGAKKMGVFTRSDEDAPPPQPGIAGGASGALADEKGSGGELIMAAEAGEFMELPPGYGLESWNPEYPHAHFESFMKSCKEMLASGLDVAAHNLSGNMTGVNYSSARIAEMSERDMWLTLQDWFFGALVMPLYREWLMTALMRGDIAFPSGKTLPPDKFAKFADLSRFQGRRWDWVDPEKDLNAAEKKIQLGLESRTAIAASMGREFDDVLEEIRTEEAQAKEAGVNLNTQAPAAPAPAAAPKKPPKEPQA